MTEPMTPARLDEIRSVQPGCWYSGRWMVRHPDGNTGRVEIVHTDGQGDTVIARMPDFLDGMAHWIVDAHTAMPELLAEVDRLRTELSKYVGHEPTISDEWAYLRSECQRVEAENERLTALFAPVELTTWAEQLQSADLTPHPAFACRGTTAGYEAAVQVATTDRLTAEAREQLLAELQKAFDETVRRVLGYRPAETGAGR